MMQRQIRLTPILLLVLGLTTVVLVVVILAVWNQMPENLKSGLPFAISTVVVVNTALLRAIPLLGKRFAAKDPPAAQQSAAVGAQLQADTPPQRQYVASAPAAATAATAAALTTKTCRRCGRAALEGDSFCRQCGSSLTGPLTPPPPVAPMPRPGRVAVGSAPTPPVLSTNTWTPGGPFVSVGGTVAVAAPVHRFMSKHALRRLLFIGTGLFILGIALYSALIYVAGACPSSADVATCSSSANTAIVILSILSMVAWLPGIVLILLADIFALIRVALIRRWGWFAAILTTYLLFWNIAMFLYVFIGPEEPPVSKPPAGVNGPPR